MIFITLGSQKFQFNRLLIEIDTMISSGIIKDEVFAQIGYSDYKPMNFKYTNFLNRNDYIKMLKKSKLVITHGGTGAIIGALKNEKKVIAIPRLEKYEEHVDDHQIEIVNQFDDMNLICACYDCQYLVKCLELINDMKFTAYISNTQNIINSIEEFIES